MIRRIKVLRSPEAVLAIGRTKKSLRRDMLWLWLALALVAGCLVVAAVALLREPAPDYLGLGAVALGAVVLGLLAGLLRRLRRQLLARDQIIFDRARGVVRRNDDVPFCALADISRVVLEAVHNADDQFCGYQLYVAAPAQGRLLVADGLCKTKDLAVAQVIAGFTGKPLERVGELAADHAARP